MLDPGVSGHRAWKHGGSPDRKRLTDDRSEADFDPRAPRRTQGNLRQPAQGARTACARLFGKQGTGRATDPRQRHPCPPAAAPAGHDRLEAWSAGGEEPACQKLCADSTPTGSQDASHVLQDKLKSHGPVCPMTRKGNCRENKRSAVLRAVRREGEARHNAPTESWFNRFKNERVHGVHHVTHAEIKAVCCL